MGSTQREEIIPAPPAYCTTIDSQGAASQPSAYAPPPGLPPPMTFDPPPGPPPPMSDASQQPDNNGAGVYPPPSLAQAPPTYEPFSFAEEYQAHVRRHTGRSDAKSAYLLSPAPRWHAPPIYHVYHDAANFNLTFHIALPSNLPPCACANDFQCQCGRRRPVLWRAVKQSKKVELLRVSPYTGLSQHAMRAEAKLLGSSSTSTIRDEDAGKLTELTQTYQQRSFTFLDGQRLHWNLAPLRLELVNDIGQPMAVLHTNVVPARLELTGFAWARMPSDELECDHAGCTLRPLYGFVFRCRDCTETGNDSFDICEPHLINECVDHDPSHRFERLPRPFGEYDDLVHETPLLRMKDVEAQRRSQELVILTLACTLLGKRG